MEERSIVFFFSLLYVMKDKVINTPMTIVAIVGMIMFLFSSILMTVYPKAGMIQEFGLQFNLAVEYSMIAGVIMVILSLLLSEKKA
jgi:hypothetical protein